MREKVRSLQEQGNYTYQKDSPGLTRTDKEDTPGRSEPTCRISRTPPRLQNFWKTKDKRKKLRIQHYTKLWKPVKTSHDSRDSPQANSRRRRPMGKVFCRGNGHMRIYQRQQLRRSIAGHFQLYPGRLFQGSQVVSLKNVVSGPTISRTGKRVPHTSVANHRTMTLALEQVLGYFCAQKPDLGQEEPWSATQLPTRTTVYNWNK